MSFKEVRKGFRPLTRTLTTFVRQFNDNYRCQFDSDFCAINNKRINYTIAVSEKNANDFRKDFASRFPMANNFDTFILFFLHELGHLQTAELVIDDSNERKTTNDYYGLYNERIATDWAGTFLTENYDFMKEWERKILNSKKKVLDFFA